MQKFISYRLFVLSLIYFLFPAKQKNKQEEEKADVQTPVTVTSVSNETMEEYVELNATSSFLQKWYVKANATATCNLPMCS